MSESLVLNLNGEVPAKKNRYKISNGRFYLDDKVKAWQENAAWEIKSQLLNSKTREFVGPVNVQVSFYVAHDKDIDNMLNSIFDLLQYVYVLKNDKDIVSIAATKRHSKQPMCLIKISTDLSTLGF